MKGVSMFRTSTLYKKVFSKIHNSSRKIKTNGSVNIPQHENFANKPVLTIVDFDIFVPCPCNECHAGVMITGFKHSQKRWKWHEQGMEGYSEEAIKASLEWGEVIISFFRENRGKDEIDTAKVTCGRDNILLITQFYMVSHWEADHHWDIDFYKETFCLPPRKAAHIPKVPTMFCDIDDREKLWTLMEIMRLANTPMLYKRKVRIPIIWCDSLELFTIDRERLYKFPKETDILMLSDEHPLEDEYFDIFCRIRGVESKNSALAWQELSNLDESLLFCARIRSYYGKKKVWGICNPNLTSLSTSQNAEEGKNDIYNILLMSFSCTVSQFLGERQSLYDYTCSKYKNWIHPDETIMSFPEWQEVLKEYEELLNKLLNLKIWRKRYHGIYFAANKDINHKVYKMFSSVDIYNDTLLVASKFALEASNVLYDKDVKSVSILPLRKKIEKLKMVFQKSKSKLLPQIDELLKNYPSTRDEIEKYIPELRTNTPDFSYLDNNNWLLEARDKSLAHSEKGYIPPEIWTQSFWATPFPLREADNAVDVLEDILSMVYHCIFQNTDLPSPSSLPSCEVHIGDYIWRYYDSLPRSKYKIWKEVSKKELFALFQPDNNVILNKDEKFITPKQAVEYK